MERLRRHKDKRWNERDLSLSLSLSLSMQQVHLSHRWSHCKAEKVLRSAPRARSYNASKNSISANQRAAGNHNVVLALLNGLFMAISGEGEVGGGPRVGQPADMIETSWLGGSRGEVSHSGDVRPRMWPLVRHMVALCLRPSCAPLLAITSPLCRPYWL